MPVTRLALICPEPEVVSTAPVPIVSVAVVFEAVVNPENGRAVAVIVPLPLVPERRTSTHHHRGDCSWFRP